MRQVTVIRAVLTRWTAHYMAYQRLLELKPALQYLAGGDLMKPPQARQLITGDKKSREKATDMVSLIMDEQFWGAITRFVIVLTYCLWVPSNENVLHQNEIAPRTFGYCNKHCSVSILPIGRGPCDLRIPLPPLFN